MYQARAQESAARFGQIADSPFLAEIYSKLEMSSRGISHEKVEELTDEERVRLTMFEMRLLRGLDNTVHQYSLGFLPEEFMDEIRFVIRSRHKLWDKLDATANTRGQFKKFIDETLEDGRT